jgi:hypothetical protein
MNLRGRPLRASRRCRDFLNPAGMSKLNLVPLDPSVGHEVNSVRVSSSEMKSEVFTCE